MPRIGAECFVPICDVCGRLALRICAIGIRTCNEYTHGVPMRAKLDYVFFRQSYFRHDTARSTDRLISRPRVTSSGGHQHSPPEAVEGHHRAPSPRLKPAPKN